MARKKVPKRNSRSKVLLDFDDFLILVMTLGRLGRTKGKGEMFFDESYDFLNLSHKGFLVHINRLLRHGYIEVERSKEDYKRKIIRITKEGEKVVWGLMNSPDVESDLREYKSRGL